MLPLLGLLAISGCRNSTGAKPKAAVKPHSHVQGAGKKPHPTNVSGLNLPLATATSNPAEPPAPRTLTKGTAVHKINTKEKVFALTFDDGPDPTYTPQVLAILKAKNVPGTFFMVGKMVRAHASTAQMVQLAGQTIGNHSWSHPMAPKAPLGEVVQTDDILKKKLGLTTDLFRPPYGIMTNGMAAVAAKRGDHIILWSTVGTDWDKKATIHSISYNILRRATPGAIALLHDGGGNRSKTVAALPTIIDTLLKQGYRFVSIPDLLAMQGSSKEGKGSQDKVKIKKLAHRPAPAHSTSPHPTPVGY